MRRRAYLTGIGIGLTALAGCSDSSNSGQEEIEPQYTMDGSMEFVSDDQSQLMSAGTARGGFGTESFGFKGDVTNNRDEEVVVSISAVTYLNDAGLEIGSIEADSNEIPISAGATKTLERKVEVSDDSFIENDNIDSFIVPLQS